MGGHDGDRDAKTKRDASYPGCLSAGSRFKRLRYGRKPLRTDNLVEIGFLSIPGLNTQPIILEEAVTPPLAN